jgi:hypothetical protein
VVVEGDVVAEEGAGEEVNLHAYILTNTEFAYV